ncbi:MAG: hypothetical protein R3D68_17690 [Hyphomicrobiaceae bacterium]
MSPLSKRLTDVGIIVGLTAAATFVIVVTASFLTSRGGYWQGVNQWLGLIKRTDIVGTAILTALVAIGYGFWQQSGRSR